MKEGEMLPDKVEEEKVVHVSVEG